MSVNKHHTLSKISQANVYDPMDSYPSPLVLLYIEAFSVG